LKHRFFSTEGERKAIKARGDRPKEIVKEEERKLDGAIVGDEKTIPSPPIQCGLTSTSIRKKKEFPICKET